MSERDERELAFDATWKALSDPTRRKILDLLNERPMTTSEIAREFDITRFAIMKHLSVLESAGLLVVSRGGRTRYNRLDRGPLARIYDRWLSQKTAWEPTLEVASASAPSPVSSEDEAPDEDRLVELSLFVRAEEKYVVERALQSVIPPVYVTSDALGRGPTSAQLEPGRFRPIVVFSLVVPESYVDPVVGSVQAALRLEGGPSSRGNGLAVVSPLGEEIVIGSTRLEPTPARRVLAEGWSEEGKGP